MASINTSRPSCESTDFKLSEGRYIDTTGGDAIWDPNLGPGLTEQCQWNGLRLDHFIVKSWNEFNTIKRPRGRSGIASTDPKVLRDRQFFDGHDRNEIFDPMPPRLVRMAEMEMLRMRRLMQRCSGVS